MQTNSFSESLDCPIVFAILRMLPNLISLVTRYAQAMEQKGNVFEFSSATFPSEDPLLLPVQPTRSIVPLGFYLAAKSDCGRLRDYPAWQTKVASPRPCQRSLSQRRRRVKIEKLVFTAYRLGSESGFSPSLLRFARLLLQSVDP